MSSVLDVLPIVVWCVVFGLRYFLFNILPKYTPVEVLGAEEVDVLIDHSRSICMKKLGPVHSKVKIKRLPKKLIGQYDGSSSMIYIDLKKMITLELSVNDLIATVIHEFVHERQNLIDKNFSKKYQEWNRKVGYDNNPYEIEANQLGSRLAPSVIKSAFND